MTGMIFVINSGLKFLNRSVEPKQLFEIQAVWFVIFFRKENMSEDYPAALK